MRAEDVLNRIHDSPFRPFRIHLSDGTTLEVPEPAMIIVGRSSAVLPSRFGRDAEGRLLAEHWRTIAIVHIVQFSDVDEPTDGKGKRRR